MPVRLVFFLITLIIIVAFIGFNIENRSDIRLWFNDKGIIRNVPIFVSMFVAYVLGVLSVIPSIVSWTFRKKNRNRPGNGVSDRRETFRKNRKTDVDESPPEEIEEEDSSKDQEL